MSAELAVTKDLFHASGGLLAIIGISWLVEALLQFLLLSLHGILPVCVCVSVFKFPLSIRAPTPGILNKGIILFQYDLTLTMNYIGNGSIFKQDTF